MSRISAAECYGNKDVITQIYSLMQTVDSSTYKDIAVRRGGNDIVFTFTANDDTVKTFSIPDAGVTDVSGTTSGSQVTITFTFTDGSTKSFTYTATGGVTVDTAQTVTGQKIFSSSDGMQVSHDLDVGGDLNVAGTTEANELTVDTNATVDGNLSVGGTTALTGAITTDVEIQGSLEAAGAAFENSSGDLVISPTNRMIVKTGAGANQELVVGTDSVIADKILESTTPTVSSDVKTVANIDYVSSTDGRNNLVHTNSDETIAGHKTLTGNPVISLNAQYVPMMLLKNSYFDRTDTTQTGASYIGFTDANGLDLCRLFYWKAGKTYTIRARFFDSAGSPHDVIIATYTEE